MFEELIAERILKWKGGKKVGPFEVQLNPTNRCNLKCKFCWLRDFDEGGLNLDELSTKKYKQIVKECKKMNVYVVEITGGGEPLMRKDILQIMKLIKKSKLFGRLVTNGTLFTQEMIEEIIKIQWDEIIFSLDAPSSKVNDFLRGKSFDSVVNSIKSFQIEKMEIGKEKPMINIHMVLCKKNYELLPQMFKFVYNLNCRNLLVEPIVLLAKKTKAGKELMFKEKDRNKLLKFLNEATKIAHQHNFQTNVDKLGFDLIKNVSKMEKIIEKEGGGENSWFSFPCYQPFYRMIIRPWGIVGPCCMFEKSPESVMEKTLKEIWFGEFFEKIRKTLLKKKLLDFCSNCNPSQVQENRKIRDCIRKLV